MACGPSGADRVLGGAHVQGRSAACVLPSGSVMVAWVPCGKSSVACRVPPLVADHACPAPPGSGRRRSGRWALTCDILGNHHDIGQPGVVLPGHVHLALDGQIARLRVDDGEQAAAVDRHVQHAVNAGRRGAELGMVQDGDGDSRDRLAVAVLHLAAQHRRPDRVDGARGHPLLDGIVARVEELRGGRQRGGDRRVHGRGHQARGRGRVVSVKVRSETPETLPARSVAWRWTVWLPSASPVERQAGREAEVARGIEGDRDGGAGVDLRLQRRHAGAVIRHLARDGDVGGRRQARTRAGDHHGGRMGIQQDRER